jgi:hypothetical protein
MPDNELSTAPEEAPINQPPVEIVHEGDTILNTVVGVMGNVLEASNVEIQLLGCCHVAPL